MSITSYATLQTAVASWLGRSGDTIVTTVVADLIMLGEMRIYRDLRIRAMETSFSTNISSGVIAVPSGYVEMKFCYIDGSPVQILTSKTAAQIYELYPTRSATGKPKFFAREVDSFIFGDYPDSNYTVKGVYYKRLDALSDSNTSNWFITNAPDLLLFAALAEADVYLKNDERVALWENKYQMIKNQIQDQDKNENGSGSPLTITVSSN